MHCSPNSVKVAKSKRISGEGLIACMGEFSNEVFRSVKLNGRDQLGDPDIDGRIIKHSRNRPCRPGGV